MKASISLGGLCWVQAPHVAPGLYSIGQGFSAGLGGILPGGRNLAIPGDIFGCHDWEKGGGVTGISWLEARGAAEHPTAPPQKNYLTLTAAGSEVENLWPGAGWCSQACPGSGCGTSGKLILVCQFPYL